MEDGAPSSCKLASPHPRPPFYTEVTREESGAELSLFYEALERGATRPRGDTRLTLSRNGAVVWSVSCDAAPCYTRLTPIGVLVTGVGLAQDERGELPSIARLLDIETGRLKRVLEPWKRWSGYRAPSTFWFLPPYLIAVRGNSRPILEVFSTTTLMPLWRTDPDDALLLWRRPHGGGPPPAVSARPKE